MFLSKIRIVRYVLANGQRVRKDTAGATKQSAFSRKYYACFRQAGRRIKVPLSVDRREARLMMRELERNLWRLKFGIVDAHAEHKRRPVAEHIEDYLADVRGRGRSERHLEDIERMLKTVMKGQRIATLDDLTMPKIDGFLQQMAEHGRSPRTRNSYRQAVVAFANWLAQKGRLPNNPLVNVSRAEGRAVRVRRALGIDELRKLIDLTEKRNANRALLYRIAVGTGLRRSELKALRVRHLWLDDPASRICLPGQYTKNRKDAAIPLVRWLADALRNAVRGKGPDDSVVQVPGDLIRRFKGDLARAGILFRDDSERVADFHSLRKCCSTLLTMQGVHPRVVQQILRHSKIDLTMTTYTDATLLPLQEAVDKMPVL